MDNRYKSARRFPWIEASLRYAGRFGVPEKKAYRHRFDLTDGMISRDQDTFRRLFNERFGASVVIKERGRLRLDDATRLPVEPVFPPLPEMREWLGVVLGPRFERVPPILRAEPPDMILRQIVQAIDERRPLRFTYQPRRGGKGERVVSPHVIVDIVGRLHLRGWDHGRNAPRDFVLSRILSIGRQVESQGYVEQAKDPDWNCYVTLEICLREGEELAAVSPDYQLDDSGRATRRVRKAHVRYLVDGEAQLKNGELRPPVIVRPARDRRARRSIDGS